MSLRNSSIDFYEALGFLDFALLPLLFLCWFGFVDKEFKPPIIVSPSLSTEESWWKEE